MSVHIVTDSGSDINYALDPCVSVLPLGVTFGSVTYQDGVDLSQDRFYELLVEGKDHPQTSQVTPFAFAQEYDRIDALDRQAQILVVALSSGLSGTCASAQTAAEGRPNVRVFDSYSVCITQHAYVRYAVELVHQGLSAAQVYDRLMAVRGRVRLVALFDTMEYLKRGGRIPAALNAVGNLLNIKPVIGVRDGDVALLGQARGSKNGRNQIRKQVEKEGVDWTLPIEFGYTGFSDELLQTYLADNRDLWEDHLGAGNLSIHRVGATIGTHAGPDAIAVGYFCAE